MTGGHEETLGGFGGGGRGKRAEAFAALEFQGRPRMPMRLESEESTGRRFTTLNNIATVAGSSRKIKQFFAFGVPARRFSLDLR